jgi:hypothetical protein
MSLLPPRGGCLRLGTGVSKGFAGALVLSVCSLVGPLAGCADLEDEAAAATGGTGGTGGEDLSTKTISIACTNNVTPDVSLLEWELTVSPVPIEAEEPFTAALEGVAVFPEFFLDAAQPPVPGGVQEVNLVSLNATVQARSGATGDERTLTNEAIPYECFFGRAPCDPANDLPGTPGVRGNTDCPESETNTCGRFVRLPTSSDCDAGGVCESLGKTGPGSQCSLNEFCITGGVEVELARELGEYMAEAEGDILFGWADESTGATLEADGTWKLREAVYDDPPGPIGLRVSVGIFTVAFECAMGVDSAGPDGPGVPNLSSPTPDERLLSFAIQR